MFLQSWQHQKLLTCGLCFECGLAAGKSLCPILGGVSLLILSLQFLQGQCFRIPF